MIQKSDGEAPANAADSRNVLYSFISITPRFTLARIGEATDRVLSMKELELSDIQTC